MIMNIVAGQMQTFMKNAVVIDLSFCCHMLVRHLSVSYSVCIRTKVL